MTHNDPVINTLLIKTSFNFLNSKITKSTFFIKYLVISYLKTCIFLLDIHMKSYFYLQSIIYTKKIAYFRLKIHQLQTSSFKKNYYEQHSMYYSIILTLDNTTNTKNMTFKYFTAWK